MIRRGRSQRGMTIPELMIGVAIVAILAATAIPSYDSSRARARLKGVADNLQLDLQSARAEAIQRNSTVTVVFGTGASWCWGVRHGAGTCDCSAAGCDVANVTSSAYRNVTMSEANFGGASARYQIGPRRGETTDVAGAPTSGYVTFSSGGLQVIAQVNPVGRIRICSPGGGVPGYPSC